MTAPRIVRGSKFRHVFGTGSKREHSLDGAQVSLDSNDWHLVKANARFLSIHWDAAGGGAFLVWPLEKLGRLPTSAPLNFGHSGPVLDTDFSPFNDHVIASAGEDGRVLLWNIPENGLSEPSSAFSGELKGHERRIVDLAWHPCAENVLASASHDLTVRIWDVSRGQANTTLAGHCDAVLDQCWSLQGDQLATSSRDKTLRIFDVRSGDRAVSVRTTAHAGVKGIRLAWLGDSNRLVSTGFGRASEREVELWDTRNLDTPLTLMSVDSASGPLLPFYDADCKLLYLAGRGDGNIRYYEMLDEAPYFYALSEYKSTDPQRGLAMLPKRAISVAENEIARFYKVYSGAPVLEPISFRVPRRDNTQFQRDIYPDAVSDEPAMSAEEFFAGKTSRPRRVSLENTFVPALHRELSLPKIAEQDGSSAGEPTTEAQLREAWQRLTRENGELRQELAQKSVRIRQLEATLESSKGH